MQLLRENTNNYREIFSQGVSLLDVRAQVEVAAGTLPGAISLPLLDDQQRHSIGSEYAANGQDSAVDMGETMFSGDLREQRIVAWRQHIADNPDGYLYCFRGGLRSRTVRKWLAECGVDYPLVEGGYKAMRNWLLTQYDRLATSANIIVVSGPTGTGKTDLIHRWPHSVDLEGHAAHRGSAFGTTFVDQPSQPSWENSVTAAWLQRENQSTQPVLFEAESQLIGRVSLSKALLAALRAAPVIELQCETPQRIERIRTDYWQFALQHFSSVQQAAGADVAGADNVSPWVQLETWVGEKLSRIQKRLGGVRYKKLMQLLSRAIVQARDHDNWEQFDEIAAILLLDYYDPLYAHAFKGRENQVVFEGNADDILEWLAQSKLAGPVCAQ